MKPTGYPTRVDGRARVARFRLARAMAAAPAALGSLLLVTLLSVTFGRWLGLLLPLVWAAGGAVLMTRVGERTTVRAACGFRRPSPAQAAELGPAWSTALQMARIAAGDVDLYVQTAAAPNAYAAGGRSVAVTSRVVVDHAIGRLPHGPLVAVLVHELGHHASGGTRPMLLLTWLTAPLRATVRILLGLASTVAGRHPRRGPGIVVLAGLAAAAVRALLRDQWMAGAVLGVLGLMGMLVPPASAVISRRCEYAADRFAADHGLAIELVAALRVLSDGNPAPRGWSRLWSTHPTCEQRIAALQTEALVQGHAERESGGCPQRRPAGSVSRGGFVPR